MLVPDASIIVDLLIDDGDRGAWAADRITSARRLHAPHLLDLEVVSALRNRVARGELSEPRAVEALGGFRSLAIRRYPAARLLDRAWELRDRLTPYDAAYISLAEALAIPLVTTDGRLARAGGHRAEVIAFA